jgi:hypothetical protein
MLPTTKLNFLSEADRRRANSTLHRLTQHKISRWVLTGGFAIELHLGRAGGEVVMRQLHDVDFIVGSFDDIPDSLGTDFVLRHVHPNDSPGKTLLQCVDPETRVRVDVFRAYGSEMERSETIGPFSLISLYDITARAARLTWDLADSVSVAPKYAGDFLRLVKLVRPEELQSIWEDHRKANMPESFAEAARELCSLIELRGDLLSIPVYSTDVNATCERCHETAKLHLADPAQVLALLGYC